MDASLKCLREIPNFTEAHEERTQAITSFNSRCSVIMVRTRVTVTMPEFFILIPIPVMVSNLETVSKYTNQQPGWLEQAETLTDFSFGLCSWISTWGSIHPSFIHMHCKKWHPCKWYLESMYCFILFLVKFLLFLSLKVSYSIIIHVCFFLKMNA